MLKIKLVEISKKLNKNATNIAKETGINRNTINTLLRGNVGDVKFSTLEKICKTYNLKIVDLLEEETSLKKEPDNNSAKPNRKLYRQEAEAVPFTCWPWALASGTFSLNNNGKKNKFGQLDLYCKNNYAVAYWDLNSLKDLANNFYGVYCDKDGYTKLYNKYLVYSSEIEDIYFDPKDIISSKIDNSELKIVFDKLKSSYRSFWETSLFIDAFDVGVDQEKISDIAKEHNLDKKEVEILTTPTEMTFADERKYALISIIKNFRVSGGNNDKKLEAYLKKNGDEINAYIKKFDYYKSNYAHIKHISIEETKEEINAYLNDKEMLKRDYEKFGQYSKNKLAEIDIILKKHHLKENPLWFFSNLTYWREHRKKINLMGIHALNSILAVLEEKTGIQKKFLSYLSFDEFDNILKKLIPGSVLERRYNGGMLITISGDSYKIYENGEADSIKSDLEMALSNDTSETKIINGQTASQGYAKGIAKIILTLEDFDKFNDGEVLVTSMTRPEFVPLMKRAVGIITNEGGITCHAAIVSRELGKPCVIGTKNATQLIKDGDLVEVRANHGTVRILK